MSVENLLKGLGITVGEPKSLIQTVDGNDQNLAKSIEAGNFDTARKGQHLTPREVLNKSLYGDENLKNTHGEEFHTDNDKQVEEVVTSAVSVSPGLDESLENTGCKESDDKKRKPSHTDEKMNKDYERLYITISKSRKLTDAELFSKALDMELDELEKSCKKAIKNAPPKPGRLPHVEKDPVQVKQEKQQKKELMRSDKDDEAQPRKKEVLKSGLEAAGADLSKSSKTALDDVFDLVKSRNAAPVAAPVVKAEPVATPAPRPAPATVKKSFVKAIGPGGVVFDFGAKTGNPIADNFSAALNLSPEPTQEAIIRDQATSFQKALTDYVTMGEQRYMQQQGSAQHDGTIHPEADKMLGKSFDEMTVEAIKSGAVTVDDKNPFAKSGAPAIQNEFNKTELQLGGETIQATSETDAAVLEMMKSMQDVEGDGSMVADISGGGRHVTIDATSGEVLQ